MYKTFLVYRSHRVFDHFEMQLRCKTISDASRQVSHLFPKGPQLKTKKHNTLYFVMLRTFQLSTPTSASLACVCARSTTCPGA